MNVKTTTEQTKDPLWREKVDLMHYAYYNLQEQQNTSRQTYSKENITAFTIFFFNRLALITFTKPSQQMTFPQQLQESARLEFADQPFQCLSRKPALNI
jgi:hypothetical protein